MTDRKNARISSARDHRRAPDKTPGSDRRAFLTGSFAAIGAGGIAMVVDIPAETVADDVPSDEPRYTETEHIRRFYRLSRF